MITNFFVDKKYAIEDIKLLGSNKSNKNPL